MATWESCLSGSIEITLEKSASLAPLAVEYFFVRLSGNRYVQGVQYQWSYSEEATLPVWAIFPFSSGTIAFDEDGVSTTSLPIEVRTTGIPDNSDLSTKVVLRVLLEGNSTQNVTIPVRLHVDAVPVAARSLVIADSPIAVVDQPYMLTIAPRDLEGLPLRHDVRHFGNTH